MPVSSPARILFHVLTETPRGPPHCHEPKLPIFHHPTLPIHDTRAPVFLFKLAHGERPRQLHLPLVRSQLYNCGGSRPRRRTLCEPADPTGTLLLYRGVFSFHCFILDGSDRVSVPIGCCAAPAILSMCHKTFFLYFLQNLDFHPSVSRPNFRPLYSPR